MDDQFFVWPVVQANSDNATAIQPTEPMLPTKPEPTLPAQPTLPTKPEPTLPTKPEPTLRTKPEPMLPAQPTLPTKPEPTLPAQPKPNPALTTSNPIVPTIPAETKPLLPILQTPRHGEPAPAPVLITSKPGVPTIPTEPTELKPAPEPGYPADPEKTHSLAITPQPLGAATPAISVSTEPKVGQQAEPSNGEHITQQCNMFRHLSLSIRISNALCTNIPSPLALMQARQRILWIDHTSLGTPTIRIWNIFQNRCIAIFKTTQAQQSMFEEPKKIFAPITTLAYSSDGHYIATGHADGQVLIWDAVTSKLFQQLGQGKSQTKSKSRHGHQAQVQDMQFSENGFLLTGDQEGKLIQWELASASEYQTQQVPVEDSIQCVAIAGDASLILASVGNNAYVYSEDKEQPMFLNHRGEVISAGIAIQKQKIYTLVLSSKSETTLCTYDLSGKKLGQQAFSMPLALDKKDTLTRP